MKGLRRSLSLLFVPLLIALLAVPAAAAPQKEKTNEDHAAWFALDPVLPTTESAEVTITGKVAGNFDMQVVNGSAVQTFVAKGQFSVTVPLVPGANTIQISGSNGQGRIVGQTVSIIRLGGNNGGGPTDPTDPTLPATQLYLEVGQNTLVADGISTMTIRVFVLDENGDTVTTYTQPITVESSNPSAIAVPSNVTPQNGTVAITLRAGMVPEPSTITVSAPGLGSAQATLTPAPQLAGRLHMTASFGTLPLGGATPGVLSLQLKDSNGLDVYQMVGVLYVQLTSSNKSIAYFGQNQSTITITMQSPTSTVPIYGGTVSGSATISGTAIRSDGQAIPVDVVTVITAP